MSEIVRRICKNCNSFLHDHPTLRGWWKCPSCGLCLMHKELITLEKYWMGRDKLFPKEFTEEVKENAKILLERVNALITSLGIKDATVSSGWRPAAINAATAGSAKKSNHMTGCAVDLLDDKEQTLANLIKSKPECLVTFDLYLENPEFTKGKNTNWVHLQTTKTKSGLRVFNPR